MDVFKNISFKQFKVIIKQHFSKKYKFVLFFIIIIFKVFYICLRQHSVLMEYSKAEYFQEHIDEKKIYFIQVIYEL